ncbi:MAG: cysteine desulfurase [Oscillospiraceae bacterium]|jgi:cysteine desulfurase|nr:cysteine desulfurase [Oscillospiraceae bacterium]
MSVIYLDHAATTPVCPAAAQAALEAMTEGFGNPSSQYPLGKAAAKRREEDRGLIATALGCEPGELFFTSCGTEGDNWAIAAAVELNRKKGNHIVTTAIEHDAVLQPMKKLKKEGFEVTFLKPDAEGSIAPEAVKAAIRPDTILVSMMLVNNEVGSILPVRAAADAIKASNSPALLHTDAVQGFLKVPFTLRDLGADLVTICAHKVRGPKGIGTLYIRKDLIPRIKPLLLGGGQEGGLRPGTEPTAQIAAFAAAVKAWEPGTADRIRAVKDYAANTLSAIDGVTLISPGDAPHILAISLPDFSGQTVVEALGGQGVCLSSGSACHRGKPSHVFEAMPLPQKVKYGALRVSFGPESTRDEVDALARLLSHICKNKTLLF